MAWGGVLQASMTTWGGVATRDAQGCGGGPLHLGLLERDIISSSFCVH